MTDQERFQQAGMWLRVLGHQTARDEEERKNILLIAEGFDDASKGNEHPQEWWKERLQKVSHHAEYASAYTYGATCDAAKLCILHQWDLAQDAIMKALRMTGLIQMYESNA